MTRLSVNTPQKQVREIFRNKNGYVEFPSRGFPLTPFEGNYYSMKSVTCFPLNSPSLKGGFPLRGNPPGGRL